MVLVVTLAVVVNQLIDNRVIDRAIDSGESYAYGQEEEQINDAIHSALLQTFDAETHSFDYTAVPEIMAEALNESGNLICEKVESAEEGYTTYKITPTEKTFYFILKINNTNGEYNLELGE